MSQRTLQDFDKENAREYPTPDLPPSYPPGFKFVCETCWRFGGHQVLKINGQVIKVTRCCSEAVIYEKDCRGRRWLDKDIEKRFWIPKPLLQPHEVKKYGLRDEIRKHQKPGIPDEDLEEQE